MNSQRNSIEAAAKLEPGSQLPQSIGKPAWETEDTSPRVQAIHHGSSLKHG